MNHNRGIEGGIIDGAAPALEARLRAYFDAPTFATAKEICEDIATPRARYSPEEVWEKLRAEGHFVKSAVKPFLTFPFDARFIYYVSKYKWLNEARSEFASNVEGNEFLISVPEPRKVSESRPVYASTLINLHVHERGSVAFPRETRADDLLADRDANIDEAAWKRLREHFGLSGERRDEPARQLVGRLFRIAFAILHSPAYQFEHASALSADWAHLPIPKDHAVFNRLVEAGEQVVRLLDADRNASGSIETVLGHERASVLGAVRRRDGGQLTPDDLNVTVTYWGGGKGRWKPREYLEEERPPETWAARWGERTGDLYINDSAFFSNVPEAVWTYQLGGYPLLKKWLGYRQANRRDGKPLTNNERQWFRSIIQRVAALLALGPALDALYQQASTNYFTSNELGISPDAVRSRREAKKMKKSASREKTPAVAQNLGRRRGAKAKQKK